MPSVLGDVLLSAKRGQAPGRFNLDFFAILLALLLPMRRYVGNFASYNRALLLQRTDVLRAYALQQVQPVQPGNIEIEHDQVADPILDVRERTDAIAAMRDLEAAPLQRAHQGARHVDVILYQQDMHDLPCRYRCAAAFIPPIHAGREPRLPTR